MQQRRATPTWSLALFVSAGLIAGVGVTLAFLKEHYVEAGFLVSIPLVLTVASVTLKDDERKRRAKRASYVLMSIGAISLAILVERQSYVELDFLLAISVPLEVGSRIVRGKAERKRSPGWVIPVFAIAGLLAAISLPSPILHGRYAEAAFWGAVLVSSVVCAMEAGRKRENHEHPLP